MEKYLKINWSIRCMVWFLSVVLVFLILSNIFWLVYFSSLQKTISLLGGSAILEKITIPWVIASFMLQFCIVYILFSVINYKRWAIIIIGIFIGIPGMLLWLWVIGSILYTLYDTGLDDMMPERWMFYCFCIVIILLTWFFIEFNRKLFKFYKNIKDFDTVERKMLRDTKPNFLYFLLIAVIPFVLLVLILMFEYRPLTPLVIPEWYFKIAWLDLNNPTYTDAKICKDFQDDMKEISEKIRTVNKEDTDVGVILGKKWLFSLSDSKIQFGTISGESIVAKNFWDWLSRLQTENQSRYETVIKQQKDEENKRSKLKNYIKNYPEEWKISLAILRSQLPIETVKKLQQLTKELPQGMNCNIRNDGNITTEYFLPLTHNIVVARVFDAAIKLSLAENDRWAAIDLLKSFHDFNVLFYSNNISLTKGMMGNTLLSIEFWSVESILENITTLEKIVIRDIYNIPYDMVENEINAWKWEQYLFEHALTGRWKSLKKLSIPYILNGEDTYTIGTTEVYAKKIAELSNDYAMQDLLEKNHNKNKWKFPREYDSYSVNSNTTENVSSLSEILKTIYNPLGKKYLWVIFPSLTSYTMRYELTSYYQDYIRYDLLWADRKK